VSERAPGQVVAGRFRLKRELGKGGMGSVWEAEHLTLKTDVAVKFIDAELAASSNNALARFAQEAKAVAAIKSPHVVSIHDFGTDEDGNPYIAMELLHHGEPLQRRLERTATLSLDEAKVFVVQMCKALQKAHAAGYIHRDLKPDNVFLCEEDEGGFSVKILDFGLAKEKGGLEMTGAGQLLGTPDYMSPEQARGKEVDFRTDLYSLGVIAYQSLTGQLPYEGKTLPDLMLAITTREPPLASTLRPDLPALVVTWLHRALQKDPAKRFDSAREMSKTFEEACTTRRMVVNVPRISTADEAEVRGEDITVRASQDAVSRIGEDITIRDSIDKSSISSNPPASADHGSSSSGGFRVDKTMPLGSDSSMFAAARATPSPSAPPQEPLERMPVPMPRTTLPPFWVIAIALIAVAVAIFMFLNRH
jgi:serine/threonine-protein kinase